MPPQPLLRPLATANWDFDHTLDKHGEERQRYMWSSGMMSEQCLYVENGNGLKTSLSSQMTRYGQLNGVTGAYG